ncbi:hypothetical protein [Aeoliella sp. SH292]|uniref:hypothetical protein n=1 Tax=Aeoliella sp. SH292 TaxID=3454464 RepID=UPI003F9B5F86
MARICCYSLVALILATPCAAVVVEPSTPFAKQYRLIDLGTLGGERDRSSATDINEAGTVVGYSETPNGRRAFVWTPTDGMQALGGIEGGYQFSVANAINDLGQIVGQVRSDGDYAYLWNSPNDARDLGTLHPEGPGYGSKALDINNRGQVVGESAYSLGSRAFIWSEATGMQSLGTLGPINTDNQARGINELGHVVGFASTNFTNDHAFYWTPELGMQDIEADPSDTTRQSYASAINDRDEVAGDRLGQADAFYWTSAGGMEPIGDLPTANDLSLAFDINNHGHIVGRGQTNFGDHAFIWSGAEGMMDLNDLLDESGEGWTVEIAYGINDRGMIVAYGSNNFGQFGRTLNRAVLLVPVPEPSGRSQLCLGVLLVGLAVSTLNWRRGLPGKAIR